MKCMYCQGLMERKTAFSPAWVCTQCGEVYFEEAEVDMMQDVMQLLDKKTKQLAVVS